MTASNRLPAGRPFGIIISACDAQRPFADELIFQESWRPSGMVLDNNVSFYVVPFPENFCVSVAFLIRTRHDR